jgi:Ca2+-binding RTX toxin-like protein
MSHRAGLLTTLVACLLAVSLPGPATAATHIGVFDASVAGQPLDDAVVYEPDPTESVHAELSQTATDLFVTAPSAMDLDVAAPCVAESTTVARCPLTAVAAFLLGGSRPATPVSVTATPDVTVDIVAGGSPWNADTLRGGAGDDRLEGARETDTGVLAADSVDGGAGDDVLFVGGAGAGDGGPGNDIIDARDGDLTATERGGDGADRLFDAATADGGAGDDEITRATQADGGDGNDRIYSAQNGTGAAGDDFVSSLGPGSTIEGGPGNDSLTAGGAGTVAHGGPGNDRLGEQNGDDRATLLAGDEGDDHLVGSSLGATLDGGPGADLLTADHSYPPYPTAPGNTFQGGAGADVIRATNNTVDRIDCGDDVDSVNRDGTDTVTGCENDSETPRRAPPRAPGPTIHATIPLAFRGTSRFTVSSKGTVHVGVRCPKGVTCAGRLRLAAGKIVLGTVTCAIKGDKTVTLKLNRAALKLLRRRHRLTATLTLVPGRLTAAPKPRRVTLILPRRH